MCSIQWSLCAWKGESTMARCTGVRAVALATAVMWSSLSGSHRHGTKSGKMLIPTFISTGFGFFLSWEFICSRPSQNQKVPNLKACSCENVSTSSCPPYLNGHFQPGESRWMQHKSNVLVGRKCWLSNPKTVGKVLMMMRVLERKRPSVVHFFCTDKILMLKF